MKNSTCFVLAVAAFVTSFAAVVSHAHAGHATARTVDVAPGLDNRPAGVTVPATADATIYVSEVTITASAPQRATRHATVRASETDAQHVARLMSAPVEIVSCAGCTARKAFETYSGKVSRLSPDSYSDNRALAPVYGSDSVILANVLAR